MFAHFAATSQNCKQELTNEVSKLVGTVAEGTLTIGKFFRIWMDVKAAHKGKDRKAMLNSCEYGEDIAKDTYEKALVNDIENLNVEQLFMIKAQQRLLKIDHHKIKSMRDLAMTDLQKSIPKNRYKI